MDERHKFLRTTYATDSMNTQTTSGKPNPPDFPLRFCSNCSRSLFLCFSSKMTTAGSLASSTPFASTNSSPNCCCLSSASRSYTVSSSVSSSKNTGYPAAALRTTILLHNTCS